MPVSVGNNASEKTCFDLAGKRILIAGHRGMVGSALVHRLAGEVEAWIRAKRPGVMLIAAAKVGGILANNGPPVATLGQNLLIEADLIRKACESGLAKLLFLGSSCIYPKHSVQPIPEDASRLRHTNAY